MNMMIFLSSASAGRLCDLRGNCSVDDLPTRQVLSNRVDTGVEFGNAFIHGRTPMVFEFNTTEGSVSIHAEASGRRCDIRDVRIKLETSSDGRKQQFKDALGRDLATVTGHGTLELTAVNLNEHLPCVISVQVSQKERSEMRIGEFDRLLHDTKVRSVFSQLPTSDLIDLEEMKHSMFPLGAENLSTLYAHQISGCEMFLGRREASTGFTKAFGPGPRLSLDSVEMGLRNFLVSLGLSPLEKLLDNDAVSAAANTGWAEDASILKSGSTFPFIHTCTAGIEDLEGLRDKLNDRKVGRFIAYIPLDLKRIRGVEWPEGTKLKYVIGLVSQDIARATKSFGLRNAVETVLVFRTAQNCSDSEYLVLFRPDGTAHVSNLHRWECGASSESAVVSRSIPTNINTTASIDIDVEQSSLSDSLRRVLDLTLNAEAEIEWGWQQDALSEAYVTGAKGVVMKDADVWEWLGIYAQVFSFDETRILSVRVEGFLTPGIGSDPPRDRDSYEIAMDNDNFRSLQSFTEQIARKLADSYSSP